LTQIKQIYKCEICGNIIEVLHSGVGELVCCNQKMNLQTENTTEASLEKHIPVIEKIGDNVFKVTVGSLEHPMDEDHYIEWIEVVADNKVYKRYLKPLDKPQAIFKIVSEELTARAYCNKHGLWKIKVNSINL
jgi:superoxide reductase